MATKPLLVKTIFDKKTSQKIASAYRIYYHPNYYHWFPELCVNIDQYFPPYR
jgi:hypothetical protein